MPTDLSAIDLATLNAAQGVIVAAFRDQCPEDQKHQQDHQGRDGSALGERLRLISHVAPAGYQGHRFRDRRPSKPLCWVRGKGGRTEEGSTGTTQEVCANCITGKTQSQKANWS
jgi:hypothetical protein